MHIASVIDCWVSCENNSFTILYGKFITAMDFVLLYSFIAVVLENLPVVVGKSLVCSDRNYWIAVKETTNFCQFQGW